MTGYTQLTQTQRYQIYALLKAEHTQKEIADILSVSPSTISRELRRNRGQRGYRPKQAQRLVDGRREKKVRRRISDQTWTHVEQLLHEQWSPEQISDWLAKEKNSHVSHEWIYQYVYRDKRHQGTLYQNLRSQKPRRKRTGIYDRRGQIKDRVSIDERPSIVDERSRLGDWEADTVIGKPGGKVLVTLAERQTRLSIIALAKNKTAQSVTEALLDSLKPLSEFVCTLTYDNGKEFAYHKTISQQLDAQGFFAHPYHSWERGLNENMNGLIRQYLPKGTDFESITSHDIQKIMDKLNNRPRKCLDFKTPNQVFFGIDPPIALKS